MSGIHHACIRGTNLPHHDVERPGCAGANLPPGVSRVAGSPQHSFRGECRTGRCHDDAPLKISLPWSSCAGWRCFWKCGRDYWRRIEFGISPGKRAGLRNCVRKSGKLCAGASPHQAQARVDGHAPADARKECGTSGQGLSNTGGRSQTIFASTFGSRRSNVSRALFSDKRKAWLAAGDGLRKIMNAMRKRGILQTAGRGLFLIVSAVLLAAAGSARFPQAAQQAPSSQVVFAVEPARCTVHWILDTTLHTVHGTFTLKRGELRLDPASSKAAGEVVVDATSGASGNDSRDKRMHKEILESPRFTEIVFKPDRIDGKVPAQGAVDLQVHGVFSLHGSDHE